MKEWLQQRFRHAACKQTLFFTSLLHVCGLYWKIRISLTTQGLKTIIVGLKKAFC